MDPGQYRWLSFYFDRTVFMVSGDSIYSRGMYTITGLSSDIEYNIIVYS